MSGHPLAAEAYRLLHDGALALADVEAAGVRIDESRLNAEITAAESKMRELESLMHGTPAWAAWQKRFGKSASLSKRAQLAEVFFKELGHRCLEVTRTGKDATKEENFAHVHDPFVDHYFRWSRLQKLRSTYLGGFAREMCDGLVHPSFALETVASYRGSCREPNLQNVPARDREIMRAIRSCVIPSPGRRIVEVDLAGAEVRVAYCYHLDPTMRKYLTDEGTDMHTDTACDLFMAGREVLDGAKKTLRPLAKTFVFAQFYGDVYFSCAAKLWKQVVRTDAKGEFTLKMPDGTPVAEYLKSKGVTSLGECDPKKTPRPGTYESHVRRVERSFWQERFSKYTAWKNRVWSDYQRDGYFDSHTGFRWRGVYRRNQVLNYGTQGASFHILLNSLIMVNDWLRREGMRSRIVNQIHDSIIADVPDDELDDYLTAVRYAVTVATPKKWQWIAIPLGVEAEVCPPDASWDAKEVWVERDGRWGPKQKKVA